MTRNNANESHCTQEADVAPGSPADEEVEHHPTPGGPLATPDTVEGHGAAEAEGEEA